jgi:hypothetical protein
LGEVTSFPGTLRDFVLILIPPSEVRHVLQNELEEEEARERNSIYNSLQKKKKLTKEIDALFHGNEPFKVIKPLIKKELIQNKVPEDEIKEIMMEKSTQQNLSLISLLNLEFEISNEKEEKKLCKSYLLLLYMNIGKNFLKY